MKTIGFENNLTGSVSTDSKGIIAPIVTNSANDAKIVKHNKRKSFFLLSLSICCHRRINSFFINIVLPCFYKTFTLIIMDKKFQIANFNNSNAEPSFKIPLVIK